MLRKGSPVNLRSFLRLCAYWSSLSPPRGDPADIVKPSHEAFFHCQYNASKYTIKKFSIHNNKKIQTVNDSLLIHRKGTVM